MIWLLGSVLCSSGILLLFRSFTDAQVHTRHAIMINYLTAASTGYLIYRPTELWFAEPWFLPSALMGVFFYMIFRVMAKTAQENGVAVSVVFSKMSVVIPVMVGLTILNESLNWLKVVGILVGIAAVVLTAQGDTRKGLWIWPLILFLGSGGIEASLKLFQVKLLGEGQTPLFISTVFSFAFLTAASHHITTTERKVSGRSALGGLILGMINFGSIYFLLKALDLPGWESSFVFPINNFAIVLCSAVLAMLLFRETPKLRVWTGLGLASFSIWLLYLST